ncbi:hypothetical protein EDD11_010326 [Mortierella claussenii]|nr:hypothetical protein EDD11_010326 [Mortierella claussenii]
MPLSTTLPFPIPFSVLTDSYKVTHPRIYPSAQKMVAYAEARQAYSKDPNDNRIVVYGIRYIIENYIAKQWTEDDVIQAEYFFKTHNAGFTNFPFPKDLFTKIVHEHNGYFPVRIEALPEGFVAYPHVPVFQIFAEGEMSRLVTFLETLLTMIWYPITVATLSRRAKDVIKAAYEKSVDENKFWSLDSRLHDFGFRGCTTIEQSVIGGTAHLLNFTGTDTMSAAFHAQFHLNRGEPVGNSIPASEHSVMMSFKTEKEAMEAMIQQFGDGVYACVMDSYDYQHALDVVLPEVAKFKVDRSAHGFLVIRPDSGDIVDAVLAGLRAADTVFGSDKNEKGYKVLRGCGVIQGDGVRYESMSKILEAVLAEGFSADNVAFGMGGGLLQKLNRDTLSFATKLSHITYQDGTKRDVMKHPKSDSDKISLPGILDVYTDEQGELKVGPRREDGVPHAGNLLKVVYDHGKVPRADTSTRQFGTQSVQDAKFVLSEKESQAAWETFGEIKKRLEHAWEHAAKVHDPVSKELHERIKYVLANSETI